MIATNNINKKNINFLKENNDNNNKQEKNNCILKNKVTKTHKYS